MPPQETIDLVKLAESTSSNGSNVNEDTVLTLLQGRARYDLPYTNIGSRTLVVVNPLRTLGNLSDSSAEDYASRYITSRGAGSYGNNKGKGSGTMLGSDQPHPYDLAGKAWTIMRRKREHQAIVYKCVSMGHYTVGPVFD